MQTPNPSASKHEVYAIATHSVLGLSTIKLTVLPSGEADRRGLCARLNATSFYAKVNATAPVAGVAFTLAIHTAKFHDGGDMLCL